MNDSTSMSGTLYIVATPIGNLQDITIRAITTLFEVDIIAAENRATTSNLLFHIKNKYPHLITSKASPKLISMNEYEEEIKIPEIMDYLTRGKSVALVSEAGTPLLSDPGFKLVQATSGKKIPIVTIPGASSIIAAISAASLPTDKFLFLGFIPKNRGKRKILFKNLKISLNSMSQNNIKPTVIFFESPHRISDSFKDLREVFGDIDVAIARELTKLHEEILKMKISEFEFGWKQHKPKGEFVILFHF